jgi:hypothetical protein
MAIVWLHTEKRIFAKLQIITGEGGRHWFGLETMHVLTEIKLI